MDGDVRETIIGSASEFGQESILTEPTDPANVPTHRKSEAESLLQVQETKRRSKRKKSNKSKSGSKRAVETPSESRHPTQAESRGPAIFPRTDAGNAELFAALYGKLLRYDHQRRRWLIWNQNWWEEDEKGRVRLFAKSAARHRLKKSANIADDEERGREAKWALQSESRHRLDAMLTLAQSEPPLADRGQNWDSNAWLLGVANGVLDLRSGTLRKGKPEDQITMHTNIAFNREAICPRFERFMLDISAGDKELSDYIQRCLGYSLTGETTEQCIFDCYGDGANGKSTLIETVRNVLGDYAYNAPFSTFEKKARSGIPNDVAALAGRRFISAVETDEGVRLNESRVKALTGGDTIAARFLYGEWFGFVISGKIWLAFNHKPEIVDDSHGMWRRIRVIPFTRKFDGNDADKHLKEKLRSVVPKFSPTPIIITPVTHRRRSSSFKSCGRRSARRFYTSPSPRREAKFARIFSALCL
jgi:putative DNA primase/helicase